MFYLIPLLQTNATPCLFSSGNRKNHVKIIADRGFQPKTQKVQSHSSKYDHKSVENGTLRRFEVPALQRPDETQKVFQVESHGHRPSTQIPTSIPEIRPEKVFRGVLRHEISMVGTEPIVVGRPTNQTNVEGTCSSWMFGCFCKPQENCTTIYGHNPLEPFTISKRTT